MRSRTYWINWLLTKEAALTATVNHSCSLKAAAARVVQTTSSPRDPLRI